MVERTVETSATPHITVEACRGDLTVRGDAARQIRLLVQRGEDEVSLTREGESFTVVIPADGTLVCPAGTSLTVERVLGNLRVEGLSGTLALGSVHGNTTLRSVGPVALKEGMGNLKARDVAGELTGEDVKGNVRVRDVEGQLKLEGVAGSLVAHQLLGGLETGVVRGNVWLGPPFVSGATYRVSAGGNLTLSLLPDVDVRLTLVAGGRIQSLVPGLDLETVEGEAHATLGAGEAAIEADVRGNVVLRSTDRGETPEMSAGLEDLGARIEWQVNAAMAELATRLESSLARVEAEPVRRRVEEATEEARRKAERAAERARMRAERAERRWRRASGARPRPKAKPVSDEERLRVLRMVEEGRLTPEQASDLLAALKGE